MKSTVSKSDMMLLHQSQRTFIDAARHVNSCEIAVMTILDVPREKARKMLESGQMLEDLDRSGLEVYDQQACSKPWSLAEIDGETLGVWLFLAVGFTVTYWCAIR